jgi:hypothetical protein
LPDNYPMVRIGSGRSEIHPRKARKTGASKW